MNSIISNTSNKILYFFEKYLPKLMKDTFKVSYTKRSRMLGMIVTVILLTVTVVDANNFISLSFGQKWLLLAFALVTPFIIGAAVMFRVSFKNHKYRRFWCFALIFLMPFVVITMTECLNRIFIYDMTYLGFFGNYMVVLLFYFFIFAISGSIRLTFLISTPIFFIFALAHNIIMDSRGTPFIPMDFVGIGTAAGIASTYTYELTYTRWIGFLIFFFIIVVSARLKTPHYRLITKIISRSVMGGVFTLLMTLFFATSVFSDMGVNPDFWNQSRGYRNYGFIFSFFCNTKYLYMSTPSGYNPEQVGSIVDSVVSKDDSLPQVQTGDYETPNIICIMNESLSDLSVLGNINTNADYMPFMRGLTENTVKGNVYVPVIGAGTSNTEFEFITGHSTAFLPSGSNAYMLYVKNDIASMVSTMKSQGYSAVALHPYYGSGWNRINVYNHLGFELFQNIENHFTPAFLQLYQQNASNPDILQTYADQYYPGENMLLRQYVSDSYNFNLIINNYEGRDRSKPFYIFNVTMQNHGGYSIPAQNFNEEIYLVNEDGSQDLRYPKTNRYLSLVKKSDEAFEELINYFSQVSEHTVICMFGDHQPSVESDFIAQTLGVPSLSDTTPQQDQQRHITPFFIWANYDIEEKTYDKLSVNYLSSLVQQIAGTQLTDYNKYLLKLSETLPVIDTVGYIDANDVYYRWSDSTEYLATLSEYEKIQYNNIFDSKHKNNTIFYLNADDADDDADDTGSGESE